MPAAVLEVMRLKAVAFQELVEVSPVALGKSSSLAHVAARTLQVCGEKIARELVARLIVRRHTRGLRSKRLLHELLAHELAVGESYMLLHQLEQLPDVSRPIRGRQQFDCLGGIDFLLATGLRGLLQEMRSQKRYVLSTAAQRWNL